MNKLLTRLLLVIPGVFLFLFLITSAIFAQTNSEDYSVEELVLKMNGQNPTIGITLPISETTKFRALGFLSMNLNFDTFASNHRYFLDLSYLTYNDWITSETVNTYWGIDLNILFEDPVIGPGLLTGLSYSLDERFAIFAEAGLNIYMNLNYDTASLTMFNSGIGMKVTL